MKEFQLKYGCNPNQGNAKIFMENGKDMPIEILNGKPGYINFLDALNSWQLVKELDLSLDMPAATSFKHVSPTSAAVGVSMSEELKKASFVDDIEGIDDSKMALAYARARGTDRMSSFGDFVALSRTCDEVTATILKREVSDGIIAPDYTPEALEILRKKKNGNYNIIKVDKAYNPDKIEKKQVFGITFQQDRNNHFISKESFKNIVTKNRELPESAVRDLIIAMTTLKYTQSNSVAFSYEGGAIGVGAGQQSRIHCTRLAAAKADLWHLRQHEKVIGLPFIENIPRAFRDNMIDMYLGKTGESPMDEALWKDILSNRPPIFTYEEKKEYLSEIKGVSLGSDAFFPFSDNIDRAYESGVSYIAEPGGSMRDDLVIEACDKYNMVAAFTGLRLFHH